MSPTLERSTIGNSHSYQKHQNETNGRSISSKAPSKPDFVLLERTSGQSYPVPQSPSMMQSSSFVVLPKSGNSNSLTVIDNRNGKTYQIPIDDGNTIKSTAFQAIKADNVGLRMFDPAYQNTAVARSKICEIDGDQGILRYRGYPIEELAEKSNFLEVSYLLIYVRFLPCRPSIPEANPSLVGPDIFKKNISTRNKQILRLMGKVPTIAAACYRHRIGRPYNNPSLNVSYTENFLNMMDNLSEPNYRSNPKLAKALDVLFILHADHELNCSTAAMRHIGSSLVDPYSAIAGAASALYGPLHGGANEAVLRMLQDIGSVAAVPAFIEQVKSRQRKLMGFGHRVYKNYDPRAKIIRKIAFEVFEICGHEPLVEVAIELERYALSDPFFVEKKLYPNVDFYSGLIYKAMGFPTDFFPVLFAIPRVAGWLAHWVESLDDKEGKIWRPRQVYVGEGKRAYVPLDSRSQNAEILTAADSHPFNKRSKVSMRSKI
ncbi:hypothetical protein BASA60_007695 [Batrachochytrium salamandrivorans]|nr:hypothetical protein BASA60_007695 [Batrachochytrium salamandrivorans]